MCLLLIHFFSFQLNLIRLDAKARAFLRNYQSKGKKQKNHPSQIFYDIIIYMIEKDRS